MLVLSSGDFLIKITFSRFFFRKHYKSVKQFESRSEPVAGSDLGPNCLQK